ncbi:unnamed protein product, partial [Amoebophrya sp. A25]
HLRGVAKQAIDAEKLHPSFFVSFSLVAAWFCFFSAQRGVSCSRCLLPMAKSLRVSTGCLVVFGVEAMEAQSRLLCFWTVNL